MAHKASLLAGIALAAVACALPAAAAGSDLIAPETVCADVHVDAPIQAQERAMHCMTDFARRQAGLRGLATAKALSQSSQRKSLDILRCNDFSHYACGRDFTYWMRETGYTSSRCWRVGENLAWGMNGRGTARSIFLAWMQSPDHRHNILSDFGQIGIGLRVGVLGQNRATHVWTQHFGSRCERSDRATSSVAQSSRPRIGLTPARVAAARSAPLAR